MSSWNYSRYVIATCSNDVTCVWHTTEPEAEAGSAMQGPTEAQMKGQFLAWLDSTDGERTRCHHSKISVTAHAPVTTPFALDRRAVYI